jgi:uncharacterized protein YjbI with pentapeptide repeats
MFPLFWKPKCSISHEPEHFQGRVISRVSFAGAHLNRVNWKVGAFEECIFKGSNLEEQAIRRLIQEGVLAEMPLSQCNLHSLTLRDRSLIDLNFERVRFSQIDFRGSNFERVTFKKCSFEGVDFTDCEMNSVSFSDCNVNPEQLFGELRSGCWRQVSVNGQDLVDFLGAANS